MICVIVLNKHVLGKQISVELDKWQNMSPYISFEKEFSLLATSCIHMTLQKVSDVYMGIYEDTFLFFSDPPEICFWVHKKTLTHIVQV